MLAPQLSHTDQRAREWPGNARERRRVVRRGRQGARAFGVGGVVVDWGRETGGEECGGGMGENESWWRTENWEGRIMHHLTMYVCRGKPRRHKHNRILPRRSISAGFPPPPGDKGLFHPRCSHHHTPAERGLVRSSGGVQVRCGVHPKDGGLWVSEGALCAVPYCQHRTHYQCNRGVIRIPSSGFSE